MIAACFVLAFFLVASLALNMAMAADIGRERKQVTHWRSLYETSVAGARELRHELTEARNATAKALGQGTRLARRMHEMSDELAGVHAELDAAEEAISQALVDLKLAQLAVEAQSKRTVPHNDGGSN